ncbi:MAG: hypothetical protein OCC49_14055 [Fibrobacterales bacterium]
MGIRSVVCIISVLLTIHVDARERGTTNNRYPDSDRDTENTKSNYGYSENATQAPKVPLCKLEYARCTIDFGLSVHASFKGLYTSDSKAKEATWNASGGYEPAKAASSTYGPDDIVEISKEPVGVSAYLLFYKIFGLRVDYLYNQYTVKESIFADVSAIDQWKVHNETLITSLMLSMYISRDRVDDVTHGTLLYLLLGRAYVWRTDEVLLKENVYLQGAPKIMENSEGFFFGFGMIQRITSFVGIEFEIGMDSFGFKPIGAFEVPEAKLTSDGGMYMKIGLAGFWEVLL